MLTVGEQAKRLLDEVINKIYALSKGKAEIERLEAVKKSYLELIDYYASRGDEYGVEKIKKLEAEFDRLLKEDKKQTAKNIGLTLVRILVELFT